MHRCGVAASAEAGVHGGDQGVGAETPTEAEPLSAAPKSKLRKAWDAATRAEREQLREEMSFDGFVPLDIWKMSTPEEQQPVRNSVIAEFFAAAAGTDILDRIPAERRKEVVGAFLDALGVDGMREVMPPELSAALRARQPVNLRAPAP